MLRSQHIPFNFFIPLKFEREVGKTVLNIFLNDVVLDLIETKIEYAPHDIENYLNDNTSFDVYVEYRHTDGSNGFIGIEVKYTELEYSFTSKEKKEINDPNSIYNQLTKRIGIYNVEYLEMLKTCKYKQVWRNQLLGERMIEVDKRFKHFTSVLLFPQGNQHFVEVCNNYKKCLKKECESRFLAITYEEFIKAAIKPEIKSWIGYLQSRYIVG